MTPEEEAEMTRDLAEIEAEKQVKSHLGCLDRAKVKQDITSYFEKDFLEGKNDKTCKALLKKLGLEE